MMFCICAISADVVVAVGQVHALALRAHLVAVEIGGALLELAEILDRAERTLRAMDLLVEQPTQTCRVETEAVGLRTYIGRLMEGSIGVEICVAIQASDAPALLRASACSLVWLNSSWGQGVSSIGSLLELHRR